MEKKVSIKRVQRYMSTMDIRSWYNQNRIHGAINYMTPQAAHEAA